MAKPTASTKPPSGMRDFLPAELRRRRHVVRVIEETYERYGFEPLETSAIEHLDTLLGKYGDEGDQLVYRLLHRREKLDRALAGDSAPTERDLADEGLRYDLTVPLARVVARHRGELPRIWRRYQIQPVWRADRPGRGRFREFYQCDVDIIGTRSGLADAEVCHAVAEVLVTLGFRDFQILVNHRQLLRSLIAWAGVPEALEATALVAIDKLDKIGRAGVLEELATRGIDATSGERLLDRALAADGSVTDQLARLGDGLDERGQAACAEIAQLFETVSSGPSAPHVALSPALARGLGYYTGLIFEVRVPDLAGSLGGGGRYDGLVGMFAGQEIPAVGFSLGLERILVVMEERAMFPDLATGPDVVVCSFPDVRPAEILGVAAALRQAGHRRVEVFPEPDRKLGQQLKHASERGAREAAIVGRSELDRGLIQLKDLSTGSQRELSIPPPVSSATPSSHPTES